LESSTLFPTSASLAGNVSGTFAVAAKSRRCAVPSSRITNRAKDTRFSTSPSSVIFESGHGLCNPKDGCWLVFIYSFPSHEGEEQTNSLLFLRKLRWRAQKFC
jgi:hypothetical protein